MNKIIVVGNKIIPLDNNDILVNDNAIKFIKNGNYYIEYIDCDIFNFNIIV